MDKLEALKAARELISKEENWCINFFATDKKGNMEFDIQSETAAKFCAVGALCRVGGAHNEFETMRWERAWEPREALRKAANRLGESDPANLNNKKGHEATLEMFDLAICMEECEREGLPVRKTKSVNKDGGTSLAPQERS